jgi:hypothetical protein
VNSALPNDLPRFQAFNFGELVFDLATDRDPTSTSAQTLSGR